MKKNIQWKTSPAARKFSRIFSVVFALIALGFVVIGVTEIIPSGAGVFGIVWTLMACAFVGIGIYGAVSRDGLYRGYGVEIEEEETPRSNAGEGHVSSIGPDVKARLEQLETLKEAGLITAREYEDKRQEILREL